MSIGLAPCRWVANAPAAMGSRWRSVLFNPLSLCGMPRLQHVADECRAHVVLCPGTRLRARDNREYHTEKLRGGYWALHFGGKSGSGMQNDLLTSNQETRPSHNCTGTCYYCGTWIDGDTTQWTLGLDSAGGLPTGTHGKWSATSRAGERNPPDTGIP